MPRRRRDRQKKGGKIRHVPGDVSRSRSRLAYGRQKSKRGLRPTERRKKHLPRRRIPRHPMLDEPIKAGKTEFDPEEKTIRRKKTITEEQRALVDNAFEKIKKIQREIKKKKSEIKNLIAEARRDYTSLDADGKFYYFMRIYDNFAEIYDLIMQMTGHFQAIREVIPITRKFLKLPIMEIAAGTCEVLKYALEQMHMPKDIRVLLNHYKIMLDNYPQSKVFEEDKEKLERVLEEIDMPDDLRSVLENYGALLEGFPRSPFLETEKHLRKIEESIESILPEFERGYFNIGEDVLIYANEPSSKMSAIGKEKLKGYDVEYTSFNATDLPEELEGKFMTVISAQFLHLPSIKDKKKIVQSIYKALKPGGYAIIIEEEKFGISPAFSDVEGVGIQLNAAACPIEKKADLVALFVLNGFEYTGIGSKMKVDNKPRHVMNSYVFRKPLTAEHMADAATEICESQIHEGKRSIADNPQHMLRCAISAAEYVEKNPEELDIEHENELMQAAAIAGLLHDFIRMPHGEEGRKRNVSTADLIEYIAGSSPDSFNDEERAVRLKLAEKHPEELRIITDFLREYPDYVSIISQVVGINQGSVADIERAFNEMIEKELFEQALLCRALMYGDKGKEETGKSAVIRRAQSISGERAEDPEDIGALKGLINRHGFSDKEFRLLAFIGESMVKMYGERTIENLPSDLQLSESEQEDGKKEGMWDKLREGAKIEAKVYDALVYYFEEYHDWGERDIFEFLRNCGFPKMKAWEDRILAKISDEEKFEPERTFAEDAVKLVLSLGYSKSLDETLRIKGESIKSEIKDVKIKSILEESNIDELKKRFASYFG